jgi:ubiquinone/menaquinone biosynthesis C-methylase UbiE
MTRLARNPLRSDDPQGGTLAPAMGRYLESDIVDWYRAHTVFLPGERAFVEDLERHRARRLLDIGVGAGRTTEYFAGLADEYVGLDLSPAMVEACGARFPDVRFEVADVRDLSRFPDGSFDVVLFSFNGVDCVGSDADRQRAFAEMRRVCAEGGRLFFSSKNLNQFLEDRRLTLQLRRALAADDGGAMPVRAARGAGRFARARVLNPSARRILTNGGGLVADDRDGLRMLRHYYVRPDVQVAQLRALGYPEVEVYGMEGERISEEQISGARGWWLHYLCRSA